MHRKSSVQEKDQALQASRGCLKAAKLEYESTMESRLAVQKEIHSLLQRQNAWTGSDVQRFTDLYKRDLDLEQSETRAKTEYKSASDEFERSHQDYLNEIRERYIEEQLYSDKIRRASTWWTWGLITCHLTLFLVIQLFVEPRKRQALLEQLSLKIQDNFSQQSIALQQVVESSSLASSKPDSLVSSSPEVAVHVKDDESASLGMTHPSSTLTPPSNPSTYYTSTLHYIQSYTQNTLFLQGLVTGASASFVAFVLFLQK